MLCCVRDNDSKSCNNRKLTPDNVGNSFNAFHNNEIISDTLRNRLRGLVDKYGMYRCLTLVKRRFQMRSCLAKKQLSLD